MNECWADYIANLIASVVLANGDEDRNQMLREEHQKVLHNLQTTIKTDKT